MQTLGVSTITRIVAAMALGAKSKQSCPDFTMALGSMAFFTARMIPTAAAPFTRRDLPHAAGMASLTMGPRYLGEAVSSHPR
jgi:hypothetical protein